jgi:hypothetical protein
MSIGEIITAIGGSAVLFAALGWVMRSIILHLLSKDIETFKTKLQMESQREMAHLKSVLDKDVEAFKAHLQIESQREMTRLKSALELVAFEHQTRFSRLHEKRAEIIGNLYGKTVDLHKAVSDFVRLFLSVDVPTKEKKLKLLWDTVDDFWEYFEKHVIYFDRGSCENIIRLKEKLSSACSILASFVQEREVIKVSYDDISVEWNKAMSIMEQEIPVVKSALEGSFKELLGVLQPNNKSYT